MGRRNLQQRMKARIVRYADDIVVPLSTSKSEYRDTYLRYKIKDKGAGYARFGIQALYGKYGLYKAPTTAVWAKAHALR